MAKKTERDDIKTEIDDIPIFGQRKFPVAPRSERQNIANTIMSKAIEVVAKKAGRQDRLVGSSPLFFALAVPALSFRYLIQNTGLPLSVFYHIVGPRAVYKSTFAIEMGRWVIMHGGVIFLCEAESKPTPVLRNSVLGEAVTNLHVEDCLSMEDWQQKAMTFIVEMQKQLVSNSEIGRTIPSAVIIDSLMGKLTEGVQSKIIKQGYAERRFADEARSLTDWLRTASGLCVGWPIIIIGINHLKESIDPVTFRPVKHTPGGFHLGHQVAVEIQMFSAGSERVIKDGVPYYINEIRMVTSKNSLGAVGKQIYVPLRQWNIIDPETKEPILKSRFEWETASIMLLRDGHGMKRTEAEILLPLIKEVVNIQKKAASSLFFCDELGVSRNSPVTAHELGCILEDNTEILATLYGILGINNLPLFNPEIDYTKQLKALAKAEEARIAQRALNSEEEDTEINDGRYSEEDDY